MIQNEGILGNEKAQADAAIAGGGIVHDSHDDAKDDSISYKDEGDRDTTQEAVSRESANKVNGETRFSQHEEEEHEESPQDLEAVTTVPSIREPFSIFTSRQKKFIVFMTAWGGFFSAVSANIYFPALNQLSADFHVSSTLINLTLTSYMIFQGLAPTMIGDLADMAGRRPAFIICFTIYIGANIGLALCQNYASLFVLRCLQSSGSSGTISLGTGVVADIATSSERGSWMGWVTAGPMIAPALGPVLGGILAEFLGWRSIFWFLTILAVVYTIPLVLFFPETGRNVVGNGSIPPQPWNVSLMTYLAARRATREAPALTRTVSRESHRREKARLAKSRKLRFPNPLHTLRVILEKDVGLLLFYNSIVYVAFYDLTSSVPYMFEQTYGFNSLQIGLCYIPFGVGAFLAPVCGGRLLDWNFRRLAKKTGMNVDRKRATDLRDFPLEKSRMQVAIPLAIFGDVCFLCYGWVMDQNAALPAPLVLQFLMGLTLTGSYNCMSVLLVDLYPLSPATATAANNLVRCLMGAGGTAAIIPMIDGMGRGWAFTLVAAVVAALTPLLFVIEKWGPQWREERRVRMERMQEEKLQKRLAEENEQSQAAEKT